MVRLDTGYASAERRCVGKEEVRRQSGRASAKWSCVGKAVVRRQNDNDCHFKISNFREKQSKTNNKTKLKTKASGKFQVTFFEVRELESGVNPVISGQMTSQIMNAFEFLRTLGARERTFA